MKTVLFIAHHDAGQEARLKCALDVVRAVGGHLNCLDVVTPLAMAGDFGSGSASAMAMVLEQEFVAEQANRARIEPRLVTAGLSYSWTEATGGLSESIRTHSILNDLVVVGSHGMPGEAARLDIAAQIVKSVGRPVLAVPHRARSMDLFGTALVAWDSSGPADAALRGAVPLLRFAKRVVIVSVGGDPMRVGLEDAAAYASRQEINVETQLLPAGFDTAYRTILQFAKAEKASWIVMGAYGHAKLREDLFGGVTRAMLDAAEVPLFLTH